MSTKTITTYEHSCDLCATVCDESDLAKVYGEPDRRPGVSAAPRVDICTGCRTRPVSDLLDYLARPAERTLAVKSG